jgi:hypothetical protein
MQVETGNQSSSRLERVEPDKKLLPGEPKRQDLPRPQEVAPNKKVCQGEPQNRSRPEPLASQPATQQVVLGKQSWNWEDLIRKH